ncbi:hypothetical protein OI25_7734 [Paraburkholderia fungorum]|uniref:Uncharacterized protein n=1 Tax=Paraburkholderia fungorum TaxID=134537 RepID=A0AAU8STB1_9BURK|nr:hypothetical protein OI25_7734 [Paraburkholderia fungorum]PRZ45511.1 hypothetical protein BX589_13826 [Paraburkholderia fungorum]
MLVLMSIHRIRTVVHELGAKPFVKSSYHGSVASAKCQLSSSVDVLVVNRDLARLCSLELSEAQHIVPVTQGRCGKISVSELLFNATQVLAYQTHLRVV